MPEIQSPNSAARAERSFSSTAIAATNLIKVIGHNEILRGINLSIGEGELTVINGESGSGKTTLINCMGGLDTISSGEVAHGLDMLSTKTPEELAEWRGQHAGFVFQNPFLMNSYDAGDNIVGPHELRGQELDYEWVGNLCRALGIAKKLRQSPATLSGGEKQRVAIARALAHRPDVLFADEPTASLDSANKEKIHELLGKLVRVTGLTVVLASHDEVSKSYADRVVTLEDGLVAADVRLPISV